MFSSSMPIYKFIILRESILYELTVWKMKWSQNSAIDSIRSSVPLRSFSELRTENCFLAFTN